MKKFILILSILGAFSLSAKRCQLNPSDPFGKHGFATVQDARAKGKPLGWIFGEMGCSQCYDCHNQDLSCECPVRTALCKKCPTPIPTLADYDINEGFCYCRNPRGKWSLVGKMKSSDCSHKFNVSHWPKGSACFKLMSKNYGNSANLDHVSLDEVLCHNCGGQQKPCLTLAKYLPPSLNNLEPKYLKNIVDLLNHPQLQDFAKNPLEFTQTQINFSNLPFKEPQIPLQLLLLWTIIIDNYEAFEELLIEGVSPNTMDKNGMSALMYAALLGRKNMVKNLVYRGALIDLPKVWQDNALLLAQKGGYWDIASWLLMNLKDDVDISI